MVKFKKTAIALAFGLGLGATGMANAADTWPMESYGPPPPPPPVEESGVQRNFYVGIGGGFLNFDNQLTDTKTLTIDNNIIRRNSNTADGGSTGINGYVVLGHGWTFSKKVYLGMEAFGNLTNAQTSLQATDTGPLTGNINSDISMTMDYAYGARLMPGFMVTPNALVYVLGGYSHAHATSSASGSFTSAQGSGSYSSDGDSFDFNGYQLGVGSMIYLNQHIALRGDFIYSGYDSQTLASAQQTGANGNIQDTISADPSTWEGNIGVVFLF